MANEGKVRLNLIYLYRPFSTNINEIPSLAKEDLLIPPQLVWEDCWKHGNGIFYPLRRQALLSKDVFDVHCFETSHGYVDEFGHPLKSMLQPCGRYVITLLNPLEAKIAISLGLISSTDDIEHVPIATTIISKKKNLNGKELTLAIPHSELQALGIDFYQLEDKLIQLIEPRLGIWVETVTDDEARHVLFVSKHNKDDDLIEAIQICLKSIGFRNYRLYDSDSGYSH